LTDVFWAGTGPLIFSPGIFSKRAQIVNGINEVFIGFFEFVEEIGILI